MVVVIVMFLGGVGAVTWGVTDDECRQPSEDVEVCVGTGTGLMASVAGGILVGAGVTLGFTSRRS